MYARLLLLVGIILTVAFAPAPFPKKQREERKSTLDRMQGWWEIVSERSYGQKGRDSSSGLRLLVKGDTLRYYIREQPADGWTIAVDDSTRPPALDKMYFGSQKGTKASYLGRAAVEGEFLTVCWISSAERPPDLSGDKGVAIRFRRERK